MRARTIIEACLVILLISLPGTLADTKTEGLDNRGEMRMLLLLALHTLTDVSGCDIVE